MSNDHPDSLDKTESHSILIALKKLISYEECNTAKKEEILDWLFNNIGYAATWTNYYFHETLENINAVDDFTPGFLDKTSKVSELLSSIKEEIPLPETADGRFDYGKKKRELNDKQNTADLLIKMINRIYDETIENQQLISLRKEKYTVPEPDQQTEIRIETNLTAEPSLAVELETTQPLVPISEEKIEEKPKDFSNSLLHQLTGFIHDLNE